MLIGIDASRAAVDQRTGTENYSVQVIRGLVQAGRDHRFRLYLRSSPSPPHGLLPEGPQVHWRKVGPRRLWTHVGLSCEMLRNPPDVLFIPAHVVPIYHPRATVVTVHDIGYRYYPQHHTLPSRLYLDLSTRLSCRVARRVIVDSESTARDLVREYRVAPGKITVVYPGVNPAMSRADRAAQEVVRRRYGLERPFLLYLGTIQPRKNLSHLIEAFARLPRDLGNVDLALVGGTGWLVGEIFRRVDELGLEDRVHFVGYVPDGDLPALLSAAECLVMPSLYEGFGLPVLEAMACGTAVVCSDASSLPEAAGEAALFFSPYDVQEMADAMVRVLTDAALRQTLVERGYAHVARFSWERASREVLDVLTEAARA
ncbi:MAG: glycosyltransferase family 4 protein [Anaerolineae bacterium]|nr:glycosyltransferase family 4 protein [Anaerolineae bacterium]